MSNNDSFKIIARKPRVFELSAPVTGYLGPDWTLWPNEIRDKVYEAMEKALTTAGVKEVEVVQAICFQDLGLWQVHIRIMEKLDWTDMKVMTIQ